MSEQPVQANLSDRVVPKVCGSDVELGNFVVIPGRALAQDTSPEASQAVLAQVKGYARQAIPGTSYWNSYTGWQYGYYKTYYNSFDNDLDAEGYSSKGYRQYAQDYGRKFLPQNGGCIYIDLNHLELCTPECTSAFDHLAASRAMLWIARDAMNKANERMPDGSTINVLANNSDGCGHSYGSHLNFLITRECFDNILYRKMHYLQFLASFEAAAIVLTGAGKVGTENAAPPAKYQISARADFLETMVSEATTYRRPLVNARDEALTGTPPTQNRRLARLHVIMFDHVLCHHAALLRVGMMQVILCMLEQGQVPVQFLLDEPVATIQRWSRDPDLSLRAALINGEQYTAVDLMQAIYEQAQRFVEAGRADGLVPQVRQIMAIWGQCLEKLRQRDMEYLAARLDWVAKKYLLERAASKRGGWDETRLKYLDNLWSSLDSNQGLYWTLEKAGAVQKLVKDEAVERFVHEPPADTRAWLRAWALRHLPEGAIDDVDWDMLRLRRRQADKFGWPVYDYSTLSMSDPLGFTRHDCQAVLESAPSPAEGLRRLFLTDDAATTGVTDRETSIVRSSNTASKLAGYTNTP